MYGTCKCRYIRAHTQHRYNSSSVIRIHVQCMYIVSTYIHTKLAEQIHNVYAWICVYMYTYTHFCYTDHTPHTETHDILDMCTFSNVGLYYQA